MNTNILEELKKINFKDEKGKIKYVDKSSSWAIWENDDDKKNEFGEEILCDANVKMIDDLKPEVINQLYIFVGLNPSSEISDENVSWSSFHKNGSNDKYLKYALYNTRFWGSYITDAIKTKYTGNSKELTKNINENEETLEINFEIFKKELECFENSGFKPKLIAMGGKAFDILKKYNRKLGQNYDIYQIKHYSSLQYKKISEESKMIYRREVLEELEKI